MNPRILTTEELRAYYNGLAMPRKRKVDASHILVWVICIAFLSCFIAG